jgi:hypothetical protein
MPSPSRLPFDTVTCSYGPTCHTLTSVPASCRPRHGPRCPRAARGMGLASYSLTATTLADMCFKCHSPADTCRVFDDRMTARDRVAWNAIVYDGGVVRNVGSSPTSSPSSAVSSPKTLTPVCPRSPATTSARSSWWHTLR